MTGPKTTFMNKQNSSAVSCKGLKYIFLYIIYIILLFNDTTMWFDIAGFPGRLIPPGSETFAPRSCPLCPPEIAPDAVAPLTFRHGHPMFVYS